MTKREKKQMFDLIASSDYPELLMELIGKWANEIVQKNNENDIKNQ